jgi:1,2-diacylglycerol 3-beta-galactosyltransferase
MSENTGTQKTQKKRLLILTADAGFGHRSAANAVLDAVKDLYGNQCVVKIVNPLDERKTPAFLRDSQADYDRLVKLPAELYQFGYDASSTVVPATIAEQALIVLLYEVMRNIVRSFRPDAILMTYPLYQSPLRAVVTIMRLQIPLLVAITDLVTVHRVWFSKTCDLALAPTENVRDLAINYGLTPEQVQVTGLPVNPQVVTEQRSAYEIRESLGWETGLTTVLAIGSRRVDRLVDALNVLNHFGHKLQLIMVAGKDEQLYQTLKEIDWHVPVCLYEYASNIPTLMKAADIVMCKAGGLVVTEALACGRPLLLIDAIPGQEIGNADYVVQNGAGSLARSSMEVLETMAHWMMNDGEMLRTCSENARALGRPNAAYEIATIFWLAANGEKYRENPARGTGRLWLVDLLTRNKIKLED